jgi:uncharacterized Zn-finger protein
METQQLLKNECLSDASVTISDKSDHESDDNFPVSKGVKKRFRCDLVECEKIFSTKYSLKRHYQKHYTKKKYKCKFCEKCFNLLQYLEEHQHIHTGSKPYTCQ